MAKFNYRKWVTDYKYSGRSLFEQNSTGSATTGSATGSASTGSASTGSAATGSASKPKLKRKLRRLNEQTGCTGSAAQIVTSCESGITLSPVDDASQAQTFTYAQVCADPSLLPIDLNNMVPDGSSICACVESVNCGDTGSEGGGCPEGTQLNTYLCPNGPTGGGETIENCCTGSSEPTGSITGSCDNFNNLASENQLLACQAYFNLANPQMDPNLTQWVDGGNCCEGIYTGSMAGGMPSPQGGSKPKPKLKEKNLKEIKYVIKRAIDNLNK